MRIRERVAWIAAVTLAVFVVAALAGVVYGGPLDPPGPPASSPGGIDGRVPISAVPYTITTSGSYVLKTNLTGTGGQSGITISANNVEIDLNGFLLDGVGGSIDGITDGGVAAANVTVRDGVVRNWGGDGIKLTASSNVRVDAVTAALNAGSGIEIGSGEVGDCVVGGPTTGVVGVRAYGAATISNCVVQGYGTGFALNGGGILRDSVSKGAYFSGIYGGAHSTITDCRVQDVGTGSPGPNNGIVVEGTSLVNGCVVENIVDSVSSDNAINVAGSSNVITGNTISGAQFGVRFQGSASNTQVYGNTYGNLTTYFEGSIADDDVGPTRPYADGGSWDQKLSSIGTLNCNTPRFRCVMGDNAVLDRETGLVWQRTPGVSTYAQGPAKEQCMQATTGGRWGWRLPRADELASLPDPATFQLAAGHPFLGVGSGDKFWTSSAQIAGTSGWQVELGAPTNPGTSLISNPFRIWCVRGHTSDPDPTG